MLGGRPDTWRRFVAHALEARQRPRWDEEEREYKLAVVEGGARAIALAAEDGEWLEAIDEALDDLFPGLGGYRYDLPDERELKWLRTWASADPLSGREAVASFADPEAAPEKRFEAYAQVVERAWSAGAAPRSEAAAVVIGSFLNFAIDPASLPLMKGWFFESLQEALEAKPLPGGLAERYAGHVSFASALEGTLRAEGVPVRDMIDVQSLVFIAARERALWAEKPPPAEPPRRSPPAYLSVVSMYRNEAPYLREWIEFNRLVGVERFFLYDNESSDDHLDVLAPYIDDGTVTVHHWPSAQVGSQDPAAVDRTPPNQARAFDHALREHCEESRWIAFVDLDEFLFSPTGRPLPEVLSAYERWPGVCVNEAVFGTSGHDVPPRGLVIESYVHRAGDSSNRYVKCIVDPVRAERCIGPHRFVYRSGLAVNEEEIPVVGPVTRSTTFDRLRINHYYMKSREEFRAKHGVHLGRQARLPMEERLSAVRDETLAAYVPALREALARGNHGRAPPSR